MDKRIDMKIKVVKNRRFTLSVEDTEFVLDNYIRHAYPDYTFSVKKSLSTESIYIYVNYCDMATKIRLSNHPNSFLKYHYISPNTRINKIIRIIVNSIQVMHDRHLNEILEDI